MPKISIILPVFNGESYLAECIDSVLAQTLPDFELLVGDDGSSDNSHSILARNKDPRVKIFLNEKNTGLFANLNLLTARATAPLVQFLCQDDALEPGCLEFEVAGLEANPKVVMTICSVYQIDSQSRVTGAWGVDPAPYAFDTEEALQRLLYEGCLPGTLSNVCVRSKALRAAGPFDETFEVAGDYEMWVRVCRQGWLADLHTRLIRLRLHSGRLSTAPSSGVKFVRETRRIIAGLIPLLPPAIRSKARRYTWWRQNVFDSNYFVRCLMSGKFAQCRELIGIMGTRHLIPGLAAWLITVNNRLYKPKPAFYQENTVNDNNLTEPRL